MKLETLLAAANAASAAGRLEEAAEVLKRAAGLYPDALPVQLSLANLLERQGDWERAYDAWNGIFLCANDEQTRDIASSARQKADEGRIVGRLNAAARAADDERHEEALSILVGTANLSPSDGIRTRICNQYYDIYAAALRARLLGTAKARGWGSAGVAALSRGPASDAHALRDRVCACFGADDPFRVKVLSLSGLGLSLLREGQHDRLSEADRDAVAKAQTDAIVFVIVDEQVSSYAFDVSTRETLPMIDSPWVGFVPGLPVNMSAWNCLPDKRHTNAQFRTEVWTPKTRYRVGEQVTFYIRSNVVCYVTLVDVQPNGDLGILLPNAHKPISSLAAETVLAMPAAGDPFTILARPPLGTEAIKLIATAKPIDVMGLPQINGFAVASADAEQQELCDHLEQFVNTLAEDEWDVSTWTFEIVEDK